MQAGQYSLEPWRFGGPDNIDGELFHFSTRPGRFFDAPPHADLPVANGFIITATAVGDSSEFSFSTAQGDFSFRASEVPYGKGIYKLGGRVYVDRVPVTTRLTDTPEEEDYPALAAGANGDVWLAYVQFHHSPDADKIRANPPAAPKDFKLYAEPTGGDQIWARKYSGGNWGENIAVTPAGRDCYKAAVAVDGSGRAWVIWSENHRGISTSSRAPWTPPGPASKCRFRTRRAPISIPLPPPTRAAGFGSPGKAGATAWRPSTPCIRRARASPSR